MDAFWVATDKAIVVLTSMGHVCLDSGSKDQGSARLSKKSRSRQLLLSLAWSRSRQPLNCPVSESLDLDNHSKSKSQKISVSTTFKILPRDHNDKGTKIGTCEETC
jgi:hypothetical protein